METRAHYVAVGVFVLAMITLAFVAVLWLTRGALNTQYAHYDIYFEGPVTGLRDGAEVDYNGVPVGKVIEVRIAPADVEKIRVTIEINADVAIKTDAAAAVETNILSGVSYIQIVGGTENALLLQAKGDERYPVIRAHRSRLASVTARAPQLLEKLIDTTDRVNKLLDQKNRQAFGESLDNLHTFSEGLASHNKEIGEFVDSANTAARTLAKLLGDLDRSYDGPDGLGSRLTATLGDFDRFAKNLSETNRQLQSALHDVQPGLRSFSQQTLGNIDTLVVQARELVTGLNRLVAELQRDPSRLLFGDRHEGYRPR